MRGNQREEGEGSHEKVFQEWLSSNWKRSAKNYRIKRLPGKRKEDSCKRRHVLGRKYTRLVFFNYRLLSSI